MSDSVLMAWAQLASEVFSVCPPHPPFPVAEPWASMVELTILNALHGYRYRALTLDEALAVVRAVSGTDPDLLALRQAALCWLQSFTS